MPLLLRLLLCLTLLANTAGGAWVAHGPASHTAALPQQASMQGCHEHAAAAPAHDGSHASLAAAPPHGAHDGCCGQAGCDCLQHCGSALPFPASVALASVPGRAPVPVMSQNRGLARPYRPIRPPIV